MIQQTMPKRYRVFENKLYSSLVLDDQMIHLEKDNTSRQLPLDFNLELELNFNLCPSKLCSLIIYSGNQTTFLKIQRGDLLQLFDECGMKVIYKGFDGNYLITETITKTRNSKIYKCKNIQTGELCCAKVIRSLDQFTQNEITICRMINQHPQENLMRTNAIYFNRTYYIIVTPFQDIFWQSKSSNVQLINWYGCVSSKINQKFIMILHTLNNNSIPSVGSLLTQLNIRVFTFQKIHYEGGTLYNYILDNKCEVDNEIAKIIMLQILEGINHLHKLGIMHRDIKLDNIMFELPNNPKSVKIIDFGFATLEKSNLTKCGTPGYIAPEVFQSENYNQLCDIYSIGAVFHALLSGYRIYDLNSQTLGKNRRNQFRKASYFKINSTANDLLDHMLCQVQRRYTAQECMEHEYFLEIDDDSEKNDIQEKLNNLIFPQITSKVYLE